MACLKYTETYLQGQGMTEPWAGESKCSYALCPPKDEVWAGRNTKLNATQNVSKIVECAVPHFWERSWL